MYEDSIAWLMLPGSSVCIRVFLLFCTTPTSVMLVHTQVGEILYNNIASEVKCRGARGDKGMDLKPGKGMDLKNIVTHE